MLQNTNSIPIFVEPFIEDFDKETLENIPATMTPHTATVRAGTKQHWFRGLENWEGATLLLQSHRRGAPARQSFRVRSHRRFQG
jgi:hypothetical protein